MEALFGGRLPGFPGTVEVLERYERRSGYEAEGPRRGTRCSHWHGPWPSTTATSASPGDTRRRQNPMGDILLARLEAASDTVG